MRHLAIIALAAALSACGPKPDSETPQGGLDPEPEPAAAPAKPHHDVPPLSSYSWLATANILVGTADEKPQMEKKLGDFYSGLPTFMMVVKMATKDRNVALRENPAYLSVIWRKYLATTSRTEDAPPTVLDEFDLGMCKYAIYLAWKEQNPDSPVDTYDDAILTVTYEK